MSEGNTWKKDRKTNAPAFSDVYLPQRNNRFVWEESLNATKDLINTVWNDKDVVEVEDAVNFTLQITLHVIGIARASVQEILFRRTKTITPDGRNPTYESMPLFTHSGALLFETLRSFPPATVIPKMSAEDTANKAGERKATLSVPQDTVVSIDVVGLHHNREFLAGWTHLPHII
ncbi:hypothetical protein IW262DRAFT_1465666 [Armillaria fumosa]|nr:hypothetical protein IW262DRAFT_1465666 [Armillaria fumosa]